MPVAPEPVGTPTPFGEIISFSASLADVAAIAAAAVVVDVSREDGATTPDLTTNTQELQGWKHSTVQNPTLKPIQRL